MAGGQVVGGRVQVKRGCGTAARRGPTRAAVAIGMTFMATAKAVAFVDGLCETCSCSEGRAKPANQRDPREPDRARPAAETQNAARGPNAKSRGVVMARWKPDPTFYPSPRMATRAPAEKLAYVVEFDPTGKSAIGWRSSTSIPSRQATPRSWTGSRSGRPETSCIISAGTPAAPACARTRRTRMSSAAISSCRACDRRASTSSILSPIPGIRSWSRRSRPSEVAKRAGYSRPHTVHCGPEGIYVSALGNAEGKGPGGVFLMDHETFDVLGRWEIDRGPQRARLRHLVAPRLRHHGDQRVGHAGHV